MSPAVTPSKYVVMATWDDAPHLNEDDKRELWESIPAFQRDARSKGIPQLGSGAIFPVNEAEIKVTPFEIPHKWPKAYGFDIGWNNTAAIWGAWDKQSDCIYLYSGYKRGVVEPSIHADAIRARGIWIKGAIDPASRGRGQIDGRKIIEVYESLGLDLVLADNSVEAGIYATWQRLSSGRLKIFANIEGWFEEYRVYRRDEKGQVVKKFDHYMDATRYLVMTGMMFASTEPEEEDTFDYAGAGSGKNSAGGY